MAKKIISIILAIPSAILAVTVDPAIWYLSLGGLFVLVGLACWNFGGENE